MAVIGGGPAGLMAAEVIASAGIPVDVYDAMPSVGRKFLLAGIGGMNITHAENLDTFLSRYGDRQAELAPFIQALDSQALRDWIHQLGVPTFVGSSGRVFPRDMKAAPLLRAWLQRLRQQGVRFHPRHRWLGWHDGGAWRLLNTATGEEQRQSFDAVVLALGGGSWPRLGSDGAWTAWLAGAGIPVTALTPSNCGFECRWSEYFKTRFAGEPVHTLTLLWTDVQGKPRQLRGECVISDYGLEGTAIYALSADMRTLLARDGHASLRLDLAPDLAEPKILSRLQQARGKDSLSNLLRKQIKLSPVKIALLRECLGEDDLRNPEQLAKAIKSLPLTLDAPRPLAEAISSAGGVCFSALDDQLMLRQKPGVFCAGEMLDWEAPTGGYLLTGCFATGRAAGHGLLRWLAAREGR